LLMSRFAERKVFPAFEELKTLTDKMARASKLQGRLQHGRVWLPENSPFTRLVLHELLRFPAGSHDDIVDALAHAVNLIVTKTPKQARRPINRLKSWRDKISTLGGLGAETHLSS